MYRESLVIFLFTILEPRPLGNFQSIYIIHTWWLMENQFLINWWVRSFFYQSNWLGSSFLHFFLLPTRRWLFFIKRNTIRERFFSKSTSSMESCHVLIHRIQYLQIYFIRHLLSDGSLSRAHTQWHKFSMLMQSLCIKNF